LKLVYLPQKLLRRRRIIYTLCLRKVKSKIKSFISGNTAHRKTKKRQKQTETQKHTQNHKQTEGQTDKLQANYINYTYLDY